MRRSQIEVARTAFSSLTAARCELSTRQLDQEATVAPSLRIYDQLVAHQEFELALDMLELSVEHVEAPDSFWLALRAAAETLGLSDRAADLRRFVERLPDNSAPCRSRKPESS